MFIQVVPIPKSGILWLFTMKKLIISKHCGTPNCTAGCSTAQCKIDACSGPLKSVGLAKRSRAHPSGPLLRITKKTREKTVKSIEPYITIPIYQNFEFLFLQIPGILRVSSWPSFCSDAFIQTFRRHRIHRKRRRQ